VSETNWLIKLKVKILIHLGVLAAQIVTVNMMNEGRTNEKARKLRYRVLWQPNTKGSQFS
jgi:hypothetical protein